MEIFYGNYQEISSIGIGNFFSMLWDWLGDIWESIKGIPKAIIDGIGNLLKWLFVPSDDYFSNVKETLLSDLETKLPYQDYINMFSTILDIAVDGQIEDISINNYSVGSLQVNVPSFLDFSFITKYRATWYAWVRGFTFIFLIIYHINQLTKFLRGFSITEGSVKSAIESSGGNKK